MAAVDTSHVQLRHAALAVSSVRVLIAVRSCFFSYLQRNAQLNGHNSSSIHIADASSNKVDSDVGSRSGVTFKVRPESQLLGVTDARFEPPLKCVDWHVIVKSGVCGMLMQF